MWRFKTVRRRVQKGVGKRCFTLLDSKKRISGMFTPLGYSPREEAVLAQLFIVIPSYSWLFPSHSERSRRAGTPLLARSQ